MKGSSEFLERRIKNTSSSREPRESKRKEVFGERKRKKRGFIQRKKQFIVIELNDRHSYSHSGFKIIVRVED